MPEFDVDRALEAKPSPAVHSVAVTFEIYQVGEEEERGWLHPPEDPIWIEPDEYDEEEEEEGKTAVDLTVDYLRGEGVTDASSSHFSVGVWYIKNGEMDGAGQVENNSYHLNGFTLEEKLQVFQRMTGRGQLRGIIGRPRPA